MLFELWLITLLWIVLVFLTQTLKLFWQSKFIKAFWFRKKLILMLFYSLWHPYEEFLKFLNLCKTQCLATNVLNQFHFWVDLYESYECKMKSKTTGCPRSDCKTLYYSTCSQGENFTHLNFTRKKTWNANVAVNDRLPKPSAEARFF